MSSPTSTLAEAVDLAARGRGSLVGSVVTHDPAFAAEFVRGVTLRQGDALLMEMEGGISISENPVFRLGYTPDGAPVTVHAEDTEDRQFDASFPGSGG